MKLVPKSVAVLCVCVELNCFPLTHLMVMMINNWFNSGNMLI